MTNLTAEELERLTSVVEEPSHRAFVFLGYYHGMRRGELLALRKSDFTKTHVQIHRLKRRKAYTQAQPLNPKEIEAVEQTLAKTEELLFPWSPAVASNLMRHYLTVAGVYTFPYQKTLHSLRHSCGRAIYRACKDIVVVADYLGHGSIDSSRRYIHSDMNEVNEIAKGAL